jgi:hypothetical protein
MNRQEEHRDDEQLLRLADGELDPKQAARAQAHLKACWQCRTRLEDLQTSIADYMRYRENVMRPLLPAPPQPWGSLRGRLRNLDADLAPRRRWPLLGASPAWLATAAALLVGMIAYRIWREPVVNAAELLRKASSAETSPSPRRRIQVKTSTRTLMRARSLRASSSVVAQPDGMVELQALFVAANFNWEEPLSARSFEAWRGQLSDKADEVSIRDDHSGGGRLYEVRTTTSASKLIDAELTIRAADLQPVREILQFEAGERVEISELPDAPADRLPPVSVAASRPVPGPPPGREPASDRIASAGDELRVIAALHRIGADLGEPIEVTRPNGKDVLVTGTGLDALRQEQIRALLAPLAGVTVRFEEPQQPVPDEPENPRRDPRRETAPVTMLQFRLQSYLGGQAALQKFTDAILDASEGAMARAHALRNLAERFPQGEEQKLSPAERNILMTLRREHSGALKEFARRMVQLVQPVLAVPERPESDAPRAASWQEGAQQLLDSTRQVDRLWNQMLAGVSSDGAAQPTPHELASALASLRARLAADEMQ